ncbi:sialoadhesin-like isoform X7 [Onychostoma macrolepis]|uniref:sialoadhesin-like isoform X7 n=1 Tax=Onychostoma macrolepis TaxID=369639 RepID=UPI00272D1340|nr:sialoadhesin-like isoform X7 [Onychostoma macrolepis]
MGSGALPLILLLMSFIRAGLTQERPKPVLKVTPDQRVFRGETVTLTCDIQPAGDIQWRYSWFKDGNTRSPYTTTTAEFSFTASVSDSGEYSCRGERSDSQRSDISAAVTLTVSDLPTSTLTVTPDSPVFTGETVNLTCVIESHSDWRQRNGLTNDRRFDRRDGWTDDWRYVWYKDSVMLQTSDRYTINRDTLTIRGATESDQGQYWCGGQRDKRPSSSHLSSVSLSVKDSPRSTLTVTPDSPVFTGETVNLTCVIESHSDWRYECSFISSSGRWSGCGIVVLVDLHLTAAAAVEIQEEQRSAA